MPILTLTLNTAGAQRRFGVVVDSLKDLTPILKEFDKYKRAKIAELFESEGRGKWPARSDRSEERGWQRTIERAQAAPRTLLRKLQRELGRATKRRAKVFSSTSATELTHAGRRKSAENAVARRSFVLAEFERQVESGQLNVGGFENADRRLMKSVRGLQPRLERAYGRAQGKGQLLGNVPQTIRSTLKNGLLVIDSSWDSPAVKALNDGATVGNNAKLEPRPFLEWEESDVEYLALLFRSRAMLAWRS